MKQGGESPHAIYLQAIKDGAGEIGAIRVIRVVFGLSLAQAKEVIVTANGWAPSLREHEASFVEPVRRALDNLDRSPDLPGEV
jgi:hypothetical protein